MKNIIIIDDNQQQLSNIEQQILDLNLPDIHIQKYQDEQIFINNIHNICEYSIFLVDIVLNKKSGIDIAKLINQHIKGAIVIFISNYLDKVVDIYDAQHYYFIYKPELEKRLPLALNKAMHSLNQLKETLPIVLKGKTIILHPSNILSLERQKHTTFIKDINQEINCSYKLDELLEKLPSYFIRCHRSYVINANKVKEIKRNEFILEDHSSIPISRAYQKTAHEKFQEYLIGNL